jgi:hypothetical protein
VRQQIRAAVKARMTPTSRRTSIRTPTVRQKRCIRAQLSSSSLQKILTEQGMPEIDPLTLGPRNGDDAASPTDHSRNFQPSAEPQDELPRDRQAIVTPVTVGSYGDAAIVDGELPAPCAAVKDTAIRPPRPGGNACTNASVTSRSAMSAKQGHAPIGGASSAANR